MRSSTSRPPVSVDARRSGVSSPKAGCRVVSQRWAAIGSPAIYLSALRHAVQVAGIHLGFVAVGIEHEQRPPFAPLAHRSAGEDVRGGGTLGEITSGSFGPSVGGPVAMGYVAAEAGEAGRAVEVVVRDRPLPARIAKLPFVLHRYFKGKGG